MGDKDEGNFKKTSRDVLWFENKYSVAIPSLFLIKKSYFFVSGSLIKNVVTATLQGHVEFITFLYFSCTLSANFKIYIVVHWRCCIFSQNSKFVHFNLRNILSVFSKGIIK
jgi:hypothetical protein